MITEECRFSIPFYDVDSMNVVWHGHYCKYLEVARCKLLDKIGFNYKAMAKLGYSFPVVDMRLKYVKPLVFEQDIIISASLVEWENRLKINYAIRDAATNTKLTTAYTIQATVDMEQGVMKLVCPSELIEKVNVLLS